MSNLKCLQEHIGAQYELLNNQTKNILGKPSKLITGESWDIVPTGQGASPPYLIWDEYKKIHKFFTALKCVSGHFSHLFFKLGHICDQSGTLPPCWDNVPTLTVF